MWTDKEGTEGTSYKNYPQFIGCHVSLNDMKHGEGKIDN